MKGRAKGNYCELLLYLSSHEKHEQDDGENIEYMATLDSQGVQEFLEKLATFDPINANDYKTMFEVVVQKEAIKALEPTFRTKFGTKTFFYSLDS